MGILKNDWQPLLAEEFSKPYYQELKSNLIYEYKNRTIYPDMYDIFNALHLTPYEKLKVVIIGQDPYHGPGQAHGLCFSVQPGVKPPPSLQNIFKELKDDVGCQIPDHGYLVQWAKQGVLLLNSILTVRKGEPGSHRGIGWEAFTDQVIKSVNKGEKPVVFMLWGKNAHEKESLITESKHYLLKSPHPSPFSAHRGFFGSAPFSKANAFLKGAGQEPINWQLPMLGTQK